MPIQGYSSPEMPQFPNREIAGLTKAWWFKIYLIRPAISWWKRGFGGLKYAFYLMFLHDSWCFCILQYLFLFILLSSLDPRKQTARSWKMMLLSEVQLGFVDFIFGQEKVAKKTHIITANKGTNWITFNNKNTNFQVKQLWIAGEYSCHHWYVRGLYLY